MSAIKSANIRVQNAYSQYFEGQRASWEDKFARLAKAVARAKKVIRAKQAVGRAEKVIRANRFVLEDENGKVRAFLTVDKDGPRLALFDENGKVRAELSVVKDGPGLGLYDGNGKPIWHVP